MCSGNKSIAIVASTLPAAFIASQATVLNIDRIIVMSRDLELSYKTINKRYPRTKIVLAPRGLVFRNLFFLFELIRSRLRGNPVVFFHECCLTPLDLLLMLVKPSGFYFPQVTMNGFEEISYGQFPRQKIVWLIRVLGLVNRFRFYKSPTIGSGPAEYVISAKEYPRTIKSQDVLYSRKLISLAVKVLNHAPTELKILYVTGKSFIDDETQVRYYLSLIDIARSKGYVCHIKDHPNPLYRLNLISDKSVTFDPLMPSELLDEDYKYVVGVSSTALLAYGDRAVSLLNLIKEITPADRDLLVDHFEKALPGNGIKYINTISEFRDLL